MPEVGEAALPDLGEPVRLGEREGGAGGEDGDEQGGGRVDAQGPGGDPGRGGVDEPAGEEREREPEKARPSLARGGRSRRYNTNQSN